MLKTIKIYINILINNLKKDLNNQEFVSQATIAGPMSYYMSL